MFQLRVGVGLFSLQYEACLKFHGYIWVNLLNGKLGVMRVVTGQWGFFHISEFWLTGDVVPTVIEPHIKKYLHI